MPSSVPTTAAAAFKKKLDRCGELLTKRQAADAEPWREELDSLIKLVREHYKASPADLPIRAEGAIFFIDLTKRENKRTVINNQRAYDALKKAMGIGPLIDALKFPFALLDRAIPVLQQTTFVTQARTGSRDVTAILRVSPKA